MKTAILSTMLFLVALVPSCTAFEKADGKPVPVIVLADTISGPEADVNAIVKTGTMILDALRRGDVDSAMDGFADDIVLIPAGHPIIKGKGQVRLFYKTQLEKVDLQDFAPAMDELVVSGDWAFSRGNSIVVVRLKGHDDNIKVVNRGMEIWKKLPNGSWKVARGIGNQ